MNGGKAATVRAVALIGPSGVGKTTLLEAMLHAAGAIPRKGSVLDGNSVGDAAPEARARGCSTELNVAGFQYLGDDFIILDCPGSVEFSVDADAAISAADLTIVVVEPDPAKAAQLQPILKMLDERGAPHAIFVNKIDKARGAVHDLIAALQRYSAEPLVARQLPIWKQGAAVGYIDLALERAFLYRNGAPSERIDIPPGDLERETEARGLLLEQIADFDDQLLETLINEQTPDPEHVFSDLTDELSRGFIVPVFLGAAESGAGVRRLLKALRHETPDLSRAAERLGANGASAIVIKTRYAGQAGRQTLVRVLSGEIADGASLVAPDGDAERVAGVNALQGETQTRRERARTGDIVCLGRLEKPARGDVIGASIGMHGPIPTARAPVFALAVETQDRQDDVKLTAAMAKLVDEDPSLNFGPNPETREFRIAGQGDLHLRVALDRLHRKFGVRVDARRPRTAYRETIQAPAAQRGRLKKQSGGHGQFAEVVIELRPAERSAGFTFEQRIHGGVVPRQYFPAVEAGIRDALAHGPLGFPVVDVEATLIDGSHHAVDSSEIAFRTAARMAVSEALANCAPILLEPVHAVTIHAPSEHVARITALAPMRRGQILGIEPREHWQCWDSVSAFMPEDELHDLILEVRSATQGMGELVSAFAHLAEVNGAAANKVIAARKAKAMH